MSYFYLDGRLKIGTPQVCADVSTVARTHEGPVYIYDLDNVRERYERLSKAFKGTSFTIHYAMKANSNPTLLAKIASWDAGVDTVSGGEIQLALKAGFKPEKIIFSGVGKTVREIELALTSGIKQINIESPAELERVANLASRLGKTANIAFRLNPDVNPQTHPYITTGFRENKFGMDETFLPELRKILAAAGPAIRLRGLTMHIGSQLLELTALREAITKTVAVFKALRSEGYALDRIDIGGGLGIDYESADEGPELQRIDEYGCIAREALGDLGCEILLEPGRILVARAGILVGEVQYIKPTPTRTFAILDTGMHHLMRPALYQARHRVLPLEHRAGPSHVYDVVGPICESSDVLAREVALPQLNTEDLVAIADAGAYGFSMASRYNSHELPREIIVSEGRWS